MLTALFVLTTIICAIGWLSQHIGVMALAYYIINNGYTEPSDDELAECTRWVVKKMFKV